MYYLIIPALAFTGLITLAGCWLGWQLLRQNVRILLRLDELENRLNDMEFAGQDEPEGSNLSDETGEKTKNGSDGRANRFSQRSVVRSKIKRDGLKAGTVAPDFHLPRLDGRGELSLEEVRGRRVLLVFSDPHCGPCNTLAPQLEKYHREHPELEVVMISRGDPKENRAKVKAQGLTFPVVLQQQWEISRRYAMFATPIAYLIDEAGIITHDIAVGVEPILELVSTAALPDRERRLVTS